MRHSPLNRLPDHFWSSLALFMLPALSLVLPSGYSYGPALLILVSIFSVRLWWGKWKLRKDIWWMWASFALLALSWLLDNWISGERGSALEKPIKILITLPCLFYLAQRPPQSRWLWHGAVVGAMGALAIAIFQASNHMDLVRIGGLRANGFTNAIQFGNIALLLATISLCGWNAAHSRENLWRLWLIIGFASGILASLLSGSRGGWLSLVIMAGLTCLYLILTRRWRPFILLTSLCSLTVIGAAQVPQLHLQERIALAQHEVQAYQQRGEANTSIGARLQMWEFAWQLYKEKPLLGWTQSGYMEQKREALEENRVDPFLNEFNHPHNELLDTASKRGSVGLMILFAIYFIPFRAFWSRFIEAKHPEAKAAYLSGLVIPIAYFGFGLTQAFLPHNSGIMVYVYLLCLLTFNDKTTKSRFNKQEEKRLENHSHPHKISTSI